MDETQLLQQAKSLLLDGDRAKGRQLLLQVIKQNPESEVAWLWLSAAVEDPQQEIQCLRRVLEINPHNELALKHWCKYPEAGPLPVPGRPSLSVAARQAVTTPKYTLPAGTAYTLIRFCPSCGAADDRGTAFCTKCGAPLPDPQKTCLRCGRSRSLFGVLGLGFSHGDYRCSRCQAEVAEAKRTFSNLAHHMLRSDVALRIKWAELERFCVQARVPIAEALQFVGFYPFFHKACDDNEIDEQEWRVLAQLCSRAERSLDAELTSARTEALKLVDRKLVRLEAQGEVGADQTERMHALMRRLQLTAHDWLRVEADLRQIILISQINKGDIPIVATGALLRAGETCHWDAPVQYWKPSSRGPTPYDGRLIITSQRVIFTAQRGGAEFPIDKIIRVHRVHKGVELELSRQTGAGYYQLDQPKVVAAILRTLVRIQNRQIVAEDDARSRHIPPEVRTAVWQRDGGRCVQCRSTEDLEFDHIIPFSKGGANTVNNIQLLCRHCNRAKSDSI
jgi:hypothetical protein